MFFGLDTVFALYSLVTCASASVTCVAQEQDRCGYAAMEAAWDAIGRLAIDPASVESLAVIDFTKPSHLPRMEIHQPDQCRPRRFLCAHGTNTGGIYACDFSNRSGSNQTSLGLYRVGQPYRGEWGLALRLVGLEAGVNDRALERTIVLHSAWYCAPGIVFQNIAEGCGPRLGRSLGCPAVPEADLAEVVARLPAGSYLYIHGSP